MQIVSVNVGLPREIVWKEMTVQTSIFKEPVQGRVKVGKLNLAGDRQADLSVHGGANKAVYGYPSEHYEFWRNELGAELSWGNFGENLTLQGLSENDLFIGDRLQVGSAVLTVVQPRMPCYKLALRFNRDDMTKRFLVSRRSGLYFSVAEEGALAAGSKIEILSRDPERVTVVDIIDLFLSDTPDQQLLERAMRVAALPVNWKVALAERASRRLVH
jgi:MOSC domain-containing protein YiiM